MITTLRGRDLRRCYDPSGFGFATTDELTDVTEPVGQPRAVAAIRLGAAATYPGFNTFAVGAVDTVRREVIGGLLRQRAATLSAPPDLCYVHNFAEPHRPRLLEVPAGRGAALRQDMASLVDELRPALTAAFEGEEFRGQRETIDDEAKAHARPLLEGLNDRAKAEGLTLLTGPMGFAFAPIREGQPMSDEDFQKLPETERERVHQRVHAFHDELAVILHQLPGWDRERRAKIRAVEREVVRGAVDHLVAEIREKYSGLANVTAYMDAVEKDLIENARRILEPEPDQPTAPGETLTDGGGQHAALRRYHVNLLVDNAKAVGAPVVLEDDPTYENLIGRIDAVSRLGAVITDFMLIRPGALHRANRGFLVVDALRVLRSPFAWDALKLALESGRVRVEPIARYYGFGSMIALEPEPLGLDVRVVLAGEPELFYLLSEHDADFRRLFKIAADFSDDLDATPEACNDYLRMLATQARRAGLRSFDASAMASVLEESTRVAGAQDRLSMRLEPLLDLMREADHVARATDGAVGASHVPTAIEARIHRLDRIRERLTEETRRGTIMIQTTGARIGQVNGLSVIPLGGFTFARPSRITARARVGEGSFVDVEREVELGGPIHSKGVLILGAFLSGRYALDTPLSLHASLVFEQSYQPVEGDSASAAELYALLPAIAGIPLKQGIAVTGSVNQHGEVQPVGGINEKIEGFFDTCRAAGLNGEQGVLIPQANVRHLMLRRDVVDAVEAGQFHVYGITTIDDGIELLTNLAPGERDETGAFPTGTFNQLVELQLEELAERRREFESPAVYQPLKSAPIEHRTVRGRNRCVPE